ncbi:MAG: rod shape-determining protein RodA [Acidimicrobiales bacterium]|nr:MAG: rod shape-determining protein RodA [Acidimicrobiales bacterium]
MTTVHTFDGPTGARIRQDDDERWWFVVDPILIACAVFITALGILLVYSATRGPVSAVQPADTSFLERQVFFAVVGLGCAFGAAMVDVRRLRSFTALGYVGLVGLLAGVLLIGVDINGAQAWYSVGGFTFQPSEPGKIIMIISLAAVLATPSIPLGRLLITLGLAAIPVGLILLQPDMGTVLVYAVVVAAMIMLSEIRGRVIVLLAIVALTVIVGAFQSDVLAEFQQDRLTVFLLSESEIDALDNPNLERVAYNAEQSQIAIGNGGLGGQGLFQGTQTGSDLVPFQETDWIFSVAGEELGFRGAGLLLGVYALLLFRMWRIALLATDRYDRLIVVGVMAMFLFQIFQSTGMAMGMMPVTGIPLPMVSYGGSSMITSLVALGLVLGVHRRRYDFTERT